MIVFDDGLDELADISIEILLAGSIQERLEGEHRLDLLEHRNLKLESLKDNPDLVTGDLLVKLHFASLQLIDSVTDGIHV